VRGSAGRQPTWLASGGMARAHVPEGGGGDGVRRGARAARGGARAGGARTGWSPTAGEVRGGSPPRSRFCDYGVVARHGRG
jgi:hypothetical protein